MRDDDTSDVRTFQQHPQRRNCPLRVYRAGHGDIWCIGINSHEDALHDATYACMCVRVYVCVCVVVCGCVRGCAVCVAVCECVWRVSVPGRHTVCKVVSAACNLEPTKVPIQKFLCTQLNRKTGRCAVALPARCCEAGCVLRACQP